MHLVLIAALGSAVLAILVWRMVSVSALEREIATVKEEARAGMMEQSGELLRLSATPMAWAIRAELLANDMTDIDAYMDKLITEKYVKRIVLVDASGTITASTNVKLKGQPAASALSGVNLEVSEPFITKDGSDLRVIVPIMDFESQIGTLVLDYSRLSLETKLPK
ncbi:MAG TPA: hypothetical protein VML75_20560 [Kofleriaceae bacterium]|nr:hypothetical protein [Kofleriaceae bacterium]